MQCGTSIAVAGVITRSARPAATVVTLNVDPGSYWSVTARMRRSASVAAR
jgi:hypothetical protein